MFIRGATFKAEITLILILIQKIRHFTFVKIKRGILLKVETVYNFLKFKVF